MVHHSVVDTSPCVSSPTSEGGPERLLSPGTEIKPVRPSAPDLRILWLRR